MTKNLCEVLISICDLTASTVSGHYLPPGHNGPYYDSETPVRNTAHWLITFTKAYKWTGEERYRDLTRSCADYICLKSARPHGFSFHHRSSHKDNCNGLIGQAWTFEALAEATALLGDPRYARIAEDVFFQHPFNEVMGLWNRLEIDGRVLSMDSAFNHQLWFAACASMIPSERRDEILRRVMRFLDRLEFNMTVLPDGLIYHPIEHLFEEQLARQFAFWNRVKKVARNCLHAVSNLRFPEKLEREDDVRRKTREKLVYKSIGYHAFKTYAFALLKHQIPEHSFWKSGRFRKMIAYLQTEEYRKGLIENKYGYPYNPPGFEVPYSLFVLGNHNKQDLVKLTQQWTNEQFRRCYNHKTHQMDRNTEDRRTHTARIYELTRMQHGILEAVEVNLPE